MEILIIGGSIFNQLINFYHTAAGQSGMWVLTMSGKFRRNHFKMLKLDKLKVREESTLKLEVMLVQSMNLTASSFRV